MNPEFHEQLSKLLDREIALDLSTRLVRHACVAIILRGKSMDDLEMAFIQRAVNLEDRWSGQLAFPGGKREEFDKTHLAATIREAKEEVNIDLTEEHLVGRLSDVQARKAGTLLDFYIRPYVFYYPENEHSVILDAAEVADFFWVPYAHLSDPARKTTYTVTHDNVKLDLPAVYLDREPPLWGLTFMMCLDLQNRLRES